MTVNVIGPYGISGDKEGHKKGLALNCSHSHSTITSCLRYQHLIRFALLLVTDKVYSYYASDSNDDDHYNFHPS